MPELLGAELYMRSAEDGVEFAEDDGFIVKDIMRTGEWPKTPGSRGVVRAPLKIIRDGVSSAKDRVIAMSDLVQAFKEGAYRYVTLPLIPEGKEHQNKAQFNTGFVKDLWIEDLGNGLSKLRAKLHFTEPDVRGKVERGTIPDVSAGVYFDVETPTGKKFPAALNHVILTPNPFIDGLNPFGVEASDDDPVVNHPDEVETFVPPAEAQVEEPEAEADAGEEPETPEEPPTLTESWDDRSSLGWRKETVQTALSSQLKLGENYNVTDIADKLAIVTNKDTGTSWTVSYELSGDGVIVAPVKQWERRGEAPESPGSEQPEEPAADAPEQRDRELAETVAGLFSSDPLEQARKLRELRASDNSEGGEVMSGRNTDVLEGIDFSDPEKVKEVVEQLANQNQSLRSKTREADVAAEIERVKGIGFSEEPGFLRAYRDILMSDDDQPAMVLLSHDDQGNKTGETQVTATEIAKKLISSLRTDDDGKVLLSAQASSSGNDDPPPAGDTDEKSVKERTKDAEAALYGTSEEEGE